MAEEKEESLATTAVKTLVEKLPLEETRPAVREIARLAERIVGAANTIFFPLHLLKRMGELWEDRLEQGLRVFGEKSAPLIEAIPEDNRRPLSIRDASDIIEGVVLLEDLDEELREMYARLLASAMDDRQEKVHPSFAKIIGELTASEAKLFDFFYRNTFTKFLIPEFMTDGSFNKLGPIDIKTAIYSLARHQLIQISWQDDDEENPDLKTAHFIRFTEFGSKFGLAVTGKFYAKEFNRAESLFQARPRIVGYGRRPSRGRG